LERSRSLAGLRSRRGLRSATRFGCADALETKIPFIVLCAILRKGEGREKDAARQMAVELLHGLRLRAKKWRCRLFHWLALLARWPLCICLWGTGWPRPDLYDSAAAGASLAVNPGGLDFAPRRNWPACRESARLMPRRRYPVLLPKSTRCNRGAVQPNLYRIPIPDALAGLPSR